MGACGSSASVVVVRFEGILEGKGVGPGIIGADLGAEVDGVSWEGNR